MPNYFPPNPDTLIRRSPEEIVQEALARRHANSGRFRQQAAPPREDDVRDQLTADSLHEIRREEDALFFSILNPDPTPRHTVSVDRAANAGADYIRAMLRESSTTREIIPPGDIVLSPPSPARRSRPVLHDIESVERVMAV